MRKLRHRLLGAALVIIVASVGTSVAQSILHGGSGIPRAQSDTLIDFTTQVEPLFQKYNCSTCHGGTNPIMGQNLSTGQAYTNIVNVASHEAAGWYRVVPGHPDISALYLKISSDTPPYGSRMPLGGPYMSAADIALVHDWIALGAAPGSGTPGPTPVIQSMATATLPPTPATAPTTIPTVLPTATMTPLPTAVPPTTFPTHTPQPTATPRPTPTTRPVAPTLTLQTTWTVVVTDRQKHPLVGSIVIIRVGTTQRGTLTDMHGIARTNIAATFARRTMRPVMALLLHGGTVYKPLTSVSVQIDAPGHVARTVVEPVTLIATAAHAVRLTIALLDAPTVGDAIRIQADAHAGTTRLHAARLYGMRATSIVLVSDATGQVISSPVPREPTGTALAKPGILLPALEGFDATIAWHVVALDAHQRCSALYLLPARALLKAV